MVFARYNDWPAILGHFIPLGINPLEVPDQLRVGDLGSAGQHHVLARSDGLWALGQDEQVRVTGAGAKLSWTPI